jgi:hypothetical protein
MNFTRTLLNTRVPLALVMLTGVWLLGCSDDDVDPQNDGGTVDALTMDSTVTPDAAPPDAEVPVLETVEVVDSQGNPLTLADVLTHDASGSLADTHVTDGQGTVQVNVPEGGSVTVVYRKSAAGSPDYYFVSTAMGLEDGGTYLAMLDVWPDHEPLDPMHVSITVDASPAGTTYYRMRIGCSGYYYSTDTRDIPDFDGCGDGNPYHIFLYATDASQARIGYGYLFNQPYVEGGSASHTLSATHTEMDPMDFSVTAIPAGAEDLELSVSAYLAGDRQEITDHDVDIETPDASETVTLRLPSIPMDRFVVKGSVDLESTITLTRSRFYDSLRDTYPQSVSWDTSTVGDVINVGDPDLTDLLRPSFSWTLDSAGTPGDALKHTFMWGDTNHVTYWVVHTPVQTSGTVQLPELPAGLAAVQLGFAVNFQGISIHHYEQYAGDGYQSFLAGDPWIERWYSRGIHWIGSP